MKRFNLPDTKPAAPSTPADIDQVTFSQLYDRYAPALLGVITAIVCDEAEAAKVLSNTFAQVRSQYGQPRAKSQPLFVWLLSIARTNALEAKKSQPPSATPVPQSIDAENTILGLSPGNNGTTSIVARRKLGASSVNELVNAVLIRNCTPEEAVSSIGLPVDTARQQLRLAMQEYRVPSVG